MKKLIFFLLLFPVLASAQSDSINVDSLKAKLSQLQVGMVYMRDNLNRAHAQFSTGASLFAGGMILVVGGSFIPAETDDEGVKDYTMRTATVVLGSAFTLLGTIFMIDSHKYIGRAGRWQFNGNTISYQL